MGLPLGVQTVSQRSRTDTLGTALFGEASYALDNDLKLTAGLRWDQQRKEFDYRQSGGSMAGYPDLSGDQGPISMRANSFEMASYSYYRWRGEVTRRAS